MPENLKIIELINKPGKETKRTPDFAELQRQKEALFKEIESNSLNLDEHDKYLIISRIIGHSVKDGLEMAKKLNADLSMPLQSVDFVEKNKTFSSKLAVFLQKNIGYATPKNVQNYRKYRQLLNALCGNDRPINDSARPNTPYIEEIDNYYKEFIRNRRLTSPEAPEDKRTQIEKTAEEHLMSAEAVLKESYYTGPVREALGLSKEKDLELAEPVEWPGRFGDLYEEQTWALRANLIDREMIARIFHARNTDATDSDEERFISSLHKSRYAPSEMLFEERKRGAIDGLLYGRKQQGIAGGKSYKEEIGGIKQSLIKRGYKEDEFEIKFDEEKGEWVVNDKRDKKEGKEECEKENLREVSGISEMIGEPNIYNKTYLSFINRIVNIIEKNRGLSLVEITPVKIKGNFVSIFAYRNSEHLLCLYWGDEKFGPYDEIKLCENSKDKLIFYAKGSGKDFINVGGQIIDVGIYPGEEIIEFLSTSDGVALISKDRDHVRMQFPEIKDVQVYSVIDFFGSVSNISSIDDKLFYIYQDKGEEYKFLKWNRRAGIEIKLEFENNQAVGLNNQVFITDGKRVLSLKYGETEFKEMTFDGEVEIANSNGKLFIIESLQNKKRVWEYDEKGELKLNEHEQRDLDLANAVAKEDLETIKDYFKKYRQKPKEGWQEPIKYGIKQMLQQSQRFVGAVNQTIKEAPELFLDTLRAKNDKPTEFLMTQMFYYMFPEAQAKREEALKDARENRKNSWNIFGGPSTGSGQAGKNEVYDYDAGVDHLASVDQVGYYEMLKAKREVLKLREPLPAGTFITNGIFGDYNGSGWSKINVPISGEIRDPAKETTFEFVDEKAGQNINLPKIANAKIITDRLKAVTAKGKEAPIEILEENNLGEVRVKKDKETKHIAYSQNYSELPKTMAEITAEDYEKFRKSFKKSFGEVMTKPIGDLGDELNIFIAGLRDKTPREQVIAIQEFCYEYGYYNLDNQPRDTDSFEERLAIMEGRMDELKTKNPELARKKYAGICTDFATLCAGLLRRAGFISGIASGFATKEKSTSISTDRAHAVSYVLWPNPENKEGKPDLIIVDGTPSSITPKIIEQEKMAAEMSKELSVDAEKELAELENILKAMDVEAIKKLENGQLEKMLNHILYGVRQSHVNVMNRVLNASRYAGFDIPKMVNGDMDSEIKFRKLLEREITSERNGAHENRERRGEELFNLILEFSERFKKDKNIKNKKEALNALEKIFTIAEKYLDPIEKRSAAAIITYLRAKKISS